MGSGSDPRDEGAGDRETRRRDIARKTERTRQRKRRLKRGVIWVKVGTMPGDWLKIAPGPWGYSPQEGQRFAAWTCDNNGNITPGAKEKRYFVDMIKRIDGNRLHYVQESW